MATEQKTVIEDVEYAIDLQELIVVNDDVSVATALKEKIMNFPKDELVLVKKIIGSSPVTIESADLYNEDFLINHF